MLNAFFIANMTSSIVSLIASTFVFVVYMMAPKKEAISTLICALALADLCSSASVIISQGTLLSGYNTFVMCVVWRCFVQFFFIASFLWTCCIAHHLYKETTLIIMHNKTMIPPLRIYHTICWGLPAILIIVLAAGGKVQPSDQNWCHLEMTYEIIFWILPMALAVIWNIVFYFLIVRSIYSVFEKKLAVSANQEALIKQEAVKKLSLLLIVFILCWAVDMFNHIAEYFFHYCPPDWAFVLQDVLAPLQGLLNSWVYGYSNNEFSTTFKKMFRCFKPKSHRSSEEPLLVN